MNAAVTEETRDRSIQDIARLAGTTSRTLRHYDDIGLLEPSRIGANGYRYYDQHALVRLQRILLLRDLGLGLPGDRRGARQPVGRGTRPRRPPGVAARGTDTTGATDRVRRNDHRSDERR